MRMRNRKDKDEIINNCNFLIRDEIIFLNNAKIHLEIGMGKGDFLLGMALNNPDINFIGVEKYASVACLAIKKISEYNLKNLKVIVDDVSNLSELLGNKIDTIYLNFSDPWPKKKHYKRRLTSINFLKLYDIFFEKKCKIFMKTDNDDLFSYSLESLKEYGYNLDKVSYDLDKENIFNIETEYEKKFKAMGIKIKYLKATK